MHCFNLYSQMTKVKYLRFKNVTWLTPILTKDANLPAAALSELCTLTRSVVLIISPEAFSSYQSKEAGQKADNDYISKRQLEGIWYKKQYFHFLKNNLLHHK